MVRISDDSGSVTKCVLDPYDRELSMVEERARAADWSRELAIQLMGRAGLRADEVRYPTPSGLRWSESGQCWLVEVRGKDTSGGEGKIRDVWLPDQVAQNIQRYISERGIGEHEELVGVSTSSVRRWVRESAEEIADDGHGERWREVSSHDLRRSWATYHIVESGVNVRTMMSLGGWSSYSAIKPYLGEPTDAKIGRDMSP